MLETLTRACPKCGVEIRYSTKKIKSHADRKNLKCLKCSRNPLRGESHPNYGKPLSDVIKSKLSVLLSGKNNPNYGKGLFGEDNPNYGTSPSEETKSRISKSNTGKKRTLEFRSKMSALRKGIIFTKEHRENISAALQERYKDPEKRHQRNRTSPNKNPGRGICGWYRDVFFRSTCELAFLIRCDEHEWKWESAETKELRISYVKDGIERWYYPDFLVSRTHHYLVEIKPKNKQNDTDVVLKQQAAEQFCRENGFRYLMVNEPSISKNIVFMMRKCGIVSLLSSKYEKQYQEWLS